jgi:hypothetical protein
MFPSNHFRAAVCLNGHVINDRLDPPPQPPPPSSEYVGVVEGSISIGPPPPPPTVPPRCGRCGARALQACRACDAPILGAHYLGVGVGLAPLERPEPFCWNCGEPFPWATREERMGKLYDLIDYEDLGEAELLTIREQIAVLSKPEEEATEEQRIRAGETIRRLAPKAWEMFRPVAQSVLTAEVKRRLELP